MKANKNNSLTNNFMNGEEHARNYNIKSFTIYEDEVKQLRHPMASQEDFNEYANGNTSMMKIDIMTPKLGYKTETLTNSTITTNVPVLQLIKLENQTENGYKICMKKESKPTSQRNHNLKGKKHQNMTSNKDESNKTSTRLLFIFPIHLSIIIIVLMLCITRSTALENTKYNLHTKTHEKSNYDKDQSSTSDHPWIRSTQYSNDRNEIKDDDKWINLTFNNFMILLIITIFSIIVFKIIRLKTTKGTTHSEIMKKHQQKEPTFHDFETQTIHTYPNIQDYLIYGDDIIINFADADNLKTSKIRMHDEHSIKNFMLVLHILPKLHEHPEDITRQQFENFADEFIRILDKLKNVTPIPTCTEIDIFMNSINKDLQTQLRENDLEGLETLDEVINSTKSYLDKIQEEKQLQKSILEFKMRKEKRETCSHFAKTTRRNIVNLINNNPKFIDVLIEKEAIRTFIFGLPRKIRKVLHGQKFDTLNATLEATKKAEQQLRIERDEKIRQIIHPKNANQPESVKRWLPKRNWSTTVKHLLTIIAIVAYVFTSTEAYPLPTQQTPMQTIHTQQTPMLTIQFPDQVIQKSQHLQNTNNNLNPEEPSTTPMYYLAVALNLPMKNTQIKKNQQATTSKTITSSTDTITAKDTVLSNSLTNATTESETNTTATQQQIFEKIWNILKNNYLIVTIFIVVTIIINIVILYMFPRKSLQHQNDMEMSSIVVNKCNRRTPQRNQHRRQQKRFYANQRNQQTTRTFDFDQYQVMMNLQSSQPKSSGNTNYTNVPESTTDFGNTSKPSPNSLIEEMPDTMQLSNENIASFITNIIKEELKQQFIPSNDLNLHPTENMDEYAHRIRNVVEQHSVNHNHDEQAMISLFIKGLTPEIRSRMVRTRYKCLPHALSCAKIARRSMENQRQQQRRQHQITPYSQLIKPSLAQKNQLPELTQQDTFVASKLQEAAALKGREEHSVENFKTSEINAESSKTPQCFTTKECKTESFNLPTMPADVSKIWSTNPMFPQHPIHTLTTTTSSEDNPDFKYNLQNDPILNPTTSSTPSPVPESTRRSQ